jgi:uncharacterized paraquat-inducible protein A
MAWHLRLSTLPELQHLTRKQRRMAIRRAVPVGTRFRLYFRPMLIGALMAAACTALVGIASTVLFVMLWMIASVCLYTLDVRRLRYEIRKQIRDELAGERPPAGLRCHFDLRGCEGDSCPECGAPI